MTPPKDGVPMIPVLVYHRVTTEAGHQLARFTVSPETFARHVAVIEAAGRQTLTIRELAQCLRRERELPDAPVAITFDDGWADTYAAVTALSRRGLSSTVFITTGLVGRAEMLSRAQVEDLAGDPRVELGAHSITHPRLDELDAAEVELQVAGSKAAVEAVTGAPVHSFAYPHGFYDDHTRAAVVSVGFGAAAAVKNAISHLDDDPFAIARWTVTCSTTPERIAEVLQGWAVPLAWHGERLKTRMYRTARRTRGRLQRELIPGWRDSRTR